MNTTSSSTSRKTRLFAIFIGLVLLLWLPFEDESETIAVLFAILICVWLLITFLVRSKDLSQFPLHYLILMGILAGAVVTPLALFLMAFKTGFHAHSVPDYTDQQIISVILRTPIWIIGGFFISMGLGIWRNYWQVEPES